MIKIKSVTVIGAVALGRQISLNKLNLTEKDTVVKPGTSCKFLITVES